MPETADISSLLNHVVPYALVFCRLAGLFMMAPILVSTMIPMRFKGLLAIMLSAAAYPLISTSGQSMAALPATTDAFGLIPLLMFEGMIGFIIGAIAGLPLLALEMAGVISGTNMGFGLARVYNPEQDFDTDLLGQLFYYIGAGAYIAFGGVETLFRTTLHSFETIPLGSFAVGQTPLTLFLGVLSSGFDLALRVSAPVTGIVSLLVVMFGVVGKSMPQVNIMSVGFTAKIFAGLAALVVAIYGIEQVIGIEITTVLRDLFHWIDAGGPGDPFAAPFASALTDTPSPIGAPR